MTSKYYEYSTHSNFHSNRYKISKHGQLSPVWRGKCKRTVPSVSSDRIRPCGMWRLQTIFVPSVLQLFTVSSLSKDRNVFSATMWRVHSKVRKLCWFGSLSLPQGRACGKLQPQAVHSAISSLPKWRDLGNKRTYSISSAAIARTKRWFNGGRWPQRGTRERAIVHRESGIRHSVMHAGSYRIEFEVSFFEVTIFDRPRWYLFTDFVRDEWHIIMFEKRKTLYCSNK